MLKKIYLFSDVKLVPKTLQEACNHLPVDTALCLRKTWILKLNLLDFGRKYCCNFCCIFCYLKVIFQYDFLRNGFTWWQTQWIPQNYIFWWKIWLSEYSCQTSFPNVKIFWACSICIPCKFITIFSNRTSVINFHRSLFGRIVELVIYVCIFS